MKSLKTEILIKNAITYDPLNEIDGERMDISIKNGKIVEKVSTKAQVINASGKIAMPGGVDIHSHIAGSKVNVGRILRPEDHEKDVQSRTKVCRSGVGYSIPSTFTTGHRYAIMGYTTVIEPASPPLKARHTHEELNDIPIIDKACFPLLGNNWFVMEYIKEKKLEECSAYVSWMLEATRGYAIKIVDPGGVEAWGWGKYLTRLDEQVPNFDITPREIIVGLCKVNRMLDLPHPIHVHTVNLGNPGNYLTTLETMDSVRELSSNDSPLIHLTHVQFTGFKGNTWLDMSSGAPEIADYVNKYKHVSVDLGQIDFGDTTTMTADGPFQFLLYKLSGNKWVNCDVEAETGAGIVPFRYKKSNYVNAIQWGIGLELALLVKDPWRIFMTTDHPNGAPFFKYPKVISWLVSQKARDKKLSKINKEAKRRLALPAIDREYTLYELAIITRAGTAKSLKLSHKGHLGSGADADVAIYDFDPSRIDPSRDYARLRKALSKASYTIKNGRIVSKNGEVIEYVNGKTFWVRSRVSEEVKNVMLADLESKFKDYYTIELDNYAVREDYLKNPQRIEANSEV